MTASATNLNTTVSNLFTNYVGQTVPNFEPIPPEKSPLTIFSKDVWGPFNITGTNTQKFGQA